MPLRLRIDGTVFRDEKNREVTLHGINLGADAKNPTEPDIPSHEPKNFFDGDDVSFLKRPFALDDAHIHFARLRRWGYNSIRYIFTWEAIEHAGPGQYDEEWIQHTISVLRIAGEYGFYVFMDPHQDVWSRFTGGSGAPMWTVYACGLNPKSLGAGEAALVQNTWPDPAKFPKMIWATNYTRSACQTMFTLFFAGKTFAPKAVINGVNIQDYLQDHYLGAIKHLAQRIKEAGDIYPNIVFAWESMNEPNRGMIGVEDISKVPSAQKLQKGTSPTAWQGMLTAAGRPCEIETWDFGSMGPYRAGTQLVDPKGVTSWLSADYDETKYGFKRAESWKLGQCLWAQHGVWDPTSDSLILKDYFGVHPVTHDKIDYEYFTNHFFMDHYRRYRDTIRGVFPDTILFCQPPVLEIPPSIKNTKDDDPNMVFAPHWYDGVTLMNKKWKWWNVDVFGVLRGKYLSPAFAIRIGESAVRNCFKGQLSAIRDEGMQYMGVRPTVFTEFGIPYDMDGQRAYKNGDYSDQIKAMDANHFGMEGSKVNFALWNYTATNRHQWGDEWNGEDLSIVSYDDPIIPRHSANRPSLDRNSPSYSQGRISNASGSGSLDSKQNMTAELARSRSGTDASDKDEKQGYRAAEAFVRPHPIVTHGDLVSYNFDLKRGEFQLHLSAPDSTKEDGPTEIFLPEFHFPKDQTEIQVSGGKWNLNTATENAESSRQVLQWWHAAGEQSLKVKGTVHKLDGGSDADDSASMMEQCKEKGCTVM